MTEHEAAPIEPGLPIQPPPAPHPESILQAPSTGSESSPQISGLIAEPWLRFFARSVDIHVWGLVLAFMMGLFFPSWFEGHAFLTSKLGSTVFEWALVPFSLLLDAGAYHLFGNTPGKWTAGIRVKSLAGEKVSFLTYLKRNFGLYWFGLGTGIPLVSLVTIWRSYQIVEGHETVRWDEGTGTRALVKSTSTPRLVTIGVIWFLLYVGGIVANVLFQFSQ
jgi:uncharacterized RDD family membrane protein YckC